MLNDIEARIQAIAEADSKASATDLSQMDSDQLLLQYMSFPDEPVYQKRIEQELKDRFNTVIWPPVML